MNSPTKKSSQLQIKGVSVISYSWITYEMLEQKGNVQQQIQLKDRWGINWYIWQIVDLHLVASQPAHIVGNCYNLFRIVEFDWWLVGSLSYCFWKSNIWSQAMSFNEYHCFLFKEGNIMSLCARWEILVPKFNDPIKINYYQKFFSHNNYYQVIKCTHGASTLKKTS